MSRFSRRSKLIVAAIVAVPVIAVLGFALFLASETGSLPWQEDPTRIAITPFSDIPGFAQPTPYPTATVAS